MYSIQFRISAIAFSLLAFSCAPEKNPMSLESSEISTSVVYGSDDRIEATEISDSKKIEALYASAAVFSNSNLVGKGNSYQLRGMKLGEKKKLCQDQPFYHQWAAARCSATLISDQLVLTAGHCVQDENKCANTSFVFGWLGKETQVPKQNVYACKKLLDVSVGDGSLSALDFALIELDRSVKNVKPISPKFSDLNAGEKIFTFGYPNGISAKYTIGKIVYSSEYTSSATAEIDGFSGNSGGGIFSEAGELRGLYSGGEVDYELDSKRSCHQVKKCKSGECLEETILQLSRIKDRIEAAQANLR
jgi:hypothetical protein